MMKLLLALWMMPWCALGAVGAVESGWVPVEQGRLFYEKTGRGPAIILIHAHSVDRRMWDAQFFALARGHAVIRYDLRGYGRSSLPVEGRDFSHAEDLARLMSGLKIERADLVGLSLGSWVALDFLAAHPEKVHSITVASGGLHDAENWRTETASQRRRRVEANRRDKLAAIQKVRAEGLAADKRDWLAVLLTWCGPQRGRIRPALAAMIQDWSGWQALHLEPAEGTSQFAASRVPETTSQILSSRKLTTPMLILIGRDDAAGSQKASESLHQVLASARVVRLPGAGHFSAMETPRAFNRALEQFLKSIPESTSPHGRAKTASAVLSF